MKKEGSIVISASRRTDLVGCFPDAFLEKLQAFPPSRVHSLVVWTKNPRNILTPGPLRHHLGQYRQVYVHLTITGMGGGEFEPAIPPWKELVAMIGPLVELTGDPERISWRFDPILEVKGERSSYGNFECFPSIAEAITPFGIRDCRVSWVFPYPKVIRRLQKRGWSLLPPDPERQKAEAEKLAQTARDYSLNLHFCAVDGLPASRCIDGEWLSSHHPDGQRCSDGKDRSQRPHCGCTESLDIGSYSLRCRNGCLYCYACP